MTCHPPWRVTQTQKLMRGHVLRQFKLKKLKKIVSGFSTVKPSIHYNVVCYNKVLLYSVSSHRNIPSNLWIWNLPVNFLRWSLSRLVIGSRASILWLGSLRPLLNMWRGRWRRRPRVIVLSVHRWRFWLDFEVGCNYQQPLRVVWITILQLRWSKCAVK